jgi:two-component system, OmpR family, sensor histidine kinase TctE
MLRTKLLWRLLPPVLIVILLASFFAYRLSLTLARDAYDAALFDSARSLAQQIHVANGSQPTLALPRAAEEILVSDPYDRIFYRVTDARGATLAGDPRVPLPVAAPTQAQPVRFYDARVGGERVRASAYGLFEGGAAPIGTVVFAETLVKRTRLSDHVLAALLVPLLVVTVLIAMLVWYGVRSGLAPLDDLASALAKRGWGDLRAVGAEGVPGEVRPLVQSLDNLMTRLDAAQSAQQRFISEAAHQLRTPLAGLSAQVERALRARDIEALKPALEQLQSSSRRVTRLVNQLLLLARAEPGADPQREFAPLDLARLVQETCRVWVPEALAAKVDLGFAGAAGPVPIVGHELLLGEMLGNLIDNALRYGARPGQAVTVRLTREPRVELAVEDEGPGIPEEERPRVFERFHRLAGSPPGGAGLGLAIVREIAHLHGAQVAVSPGPGGRGATFRVAF